jgi:anthranilate phosphoribosyltransferase
MNNYEHIFDQIIEKKLSDEEVKEFLLNLNKQNLPLPAFQGAVSALKKHMKKISAPENAIDVCGTGGDRLGTLNISTAVCFVVAAAGIPVAKHGNKAVSSNSGSADIFAELGVKISSDIDEIEKNLRSKKLCFLFAPFFHESMKNVAQIRKSLAKDFNTPTIFNFLGPLLNPANTHFQLIGVSRKDVMEKMAKVVSSNAKRAFIVHGFDGMDEISLCDNSHLLRCENGKIFADEIVNPEKFGFKRVALEALKGKDPQHNAKKLIALLDGEKSAYRDIVILNAAFALKVAGAVKEIGEGVEMACAMIDQGKAAAVLNALKS